MFCRDSQLTALKKQGYSIFRLPREDVRPLELVIEVGARYQRIGQMSSLFTAYKTPVPAVSHNNKCGSITGAVTRKMDAGLGLKILDDIIVAMGGATAVVDAAFVNTARIAFEFCDVLEDHVDILELDKFLNAAAINRHARHTGELLNANQVCVLTSVVKSNKLNVIASSDGVADLTAKVASIQGRLGTGIKAEVSNSGTVSFSGEKHLVFGAQAVQLSYSDGEYKAYVPVIPGSREFSRDGGVGTSAPQRTYAEYDGALMSLFDGPNV